MKTEYKSIDTDVAIIGAGPVGLFAVFELGLLDIKAAVIDVLPKPGGQCAELYPEKPIYDIPGLPVVTGADLTTNLIAQIKPFAPEFVLGQSAVSFAPTPAGFWNITTDTGTVVRARTVMLATGGGLFTPKKLPQPVAITYENTSLFYAVRSRAAFAGKRVVVAGGGDSAIDWAIDLVEHGVDVTLTHRRDEFRAAPARVAHMRDLVAAGKMQLAIGQIAGLNGLAPQLTSITLSVGTGIDAITQDIPTDALLVFYGLTMNAPPLTGLNLILENGLVPVDTENFATKTPGVYAIGDICTYPGKLKLILSGFHEGALAAQAIFKYMYPDRKLRFQYTTTASDLHRKLGV